MVLWTLGFVQLAMKLTGQNLYITEITNYLEGLLFKENFDIIKQGLLNC